MTESDYIGAYWGARLRPARPPSETVDIPGRGTIFMVTRDHRFSAANPADVERALALTAYLEASGALVPIPSTEPFRAGSAGS